MAYSKEEFNERTSLVDGSNGHSYATAMSSPSIQAPDKSESPNSPRLTRWRYFVLLLSHLELLIYSGLINGWPSLLYVLKAEGLFLDTCDTNSNDTTLDWSSKNSSSPSSFPSSIEYNLATDCTSREIHFASVYANSVGFVGLGSILTGRLYAIVGARVTKIVGIFLLCCGFVQVAFAERGLEWLLYPGMVFLAVGGITLKTTNVPVGNLFPKCKSIMIGVLYGAYSSSAAVQFLVKLAFEAGISHQTSYLFMAALCLFMIPATLIFQPAKFIEVPKNVKEISINNGKESAAQAVDENDLVVSSLTFETKRVCTVEESKETKKDFESIRRLLITGDSIRMHLWFYGTLTCSMFFVITINYRLEDVLSSMDEVSWYTDIMMILQAAGLFLNPISGLIYDVAYNYMPKYILGKDRCRLALTVPFLMGTAVVTSIGVLNFFQAEWVFYPSFVLLALCRVFTLGLSTLYVMTLFPSHSVGVFFGTCCAVQSAVGFSQHAYVLWMESAGYTQPMVCIITLVALTSIPSLYVVFRLYLCRNVMAKREEVEDS